MDDFVVNVRQIAQFDDTPEVQADDLLILQRAGLGGPYVSTTAATLVSTALADSGPFSVGWPAPPDCMPDQILTGRVKILTGHSYAWNTYLDYEGINRYWFNGIAGAIGYNTQVPGFVFWSAPAGIAGETVDFDEVATISTDGNMALAGQLTLGREASNALEAATYSQLQQAISDLLEHANALHAENTVWGFNGRTGCVELELADIVGAGGAPAHDPTFTGHVHVDGTTSLLGPAFAQTIQDPDDSSHHIATTEFVQNAITDFAGENSGTACGACPPLGAPWGKLWWDDANKQLFVFDGQQWVIAVNPPSRALASLTHRPPPNPLPGTLWWDGDELKMWNGRRWVSVSNVSKDKPIVPSPPTWDNSNRIATTHWVRGLVRRTADDTLFDAIDTTKRMLRRYAPLRSPDFVGMPTAPTPPPGSNDAKIATTAFVRHAIVRATTGVASFDGRTGDIRLTTDDIVAAGGAPINAPHFIGFPEAETPPPDTYSHILATTQWVIDTLNTRYADVVDSFNGRRGDVTLRLDDIEAVGGAPLRDPVFLGVPRAPNPAPSDSSNQIATTKFVSDNIATTYDILNGRIISLGNEMRDGFFNIATHSVYSFNQRTGAVTLRATDIQAAGGALLDSPRFFGFPTAPTPPPASNNPRIATTAYVDRAIWSNPGPPGPPGVPGGEGPAGPPGRGMEVLGTVDNVSELPTQDNLVGDIWMVKDDGAFWWDGHMWQPLDQITIAGPYVPLAGGTMTGPLTLSGDATTPLEPVTLEQFDALVLPLLGQFLPLTGGTLTGNLNIANPTAGVGNILTLNRVTGAAGTPNINAIQFRTGGLMRWSLQQGYGAGAEGGEWGGELYLYAFSDNGAPKATPWITVARNNGMVSFTGQVYVGPMFGVHVGTGAQTAWYNGNQVIFSDSTATPGVSGERDLHSTEVHTPDTTRWRWGVGLSYWPSNGPWTLEVFPGDGSGSFTCLDFDKATGLGLVAADPVADLGIATKHYVDTHGGGLPAGDLTVDGGVSAQWFYANDFYVGDTNDPTYIYLASNGTIHFANAWQIRALDDENFQIVGPGHVIAGGIDITALEARVAALEAAR